MIDSVWKFFTHNGNNCTTLKNTSGTSWFSAQIVSLFALTLGFVLILLVRCPRIYLLVPFGTVLDDFIANLTTHVQDAIDEIEPQPINC